jgi:SAM-dependent methyltransferase
MSEHHGEIQFTPEFWDDRYGSSDRMWSGLPNVQLVAQASDLPPGAALDVGCGEGADAIWLAARGWHVTAVDISTVALDRGARQAAAQGIGGITWQQQDLLTWDPGPARYDLVSAQFFYLPRPAFEQMRARLAAAVRPGGTLLLVGHVADHLLAHGAMAAGMAWTAADRAGGLDAVDWDILVAGDVEREAAGDGMHLADTVLRARRRG